MDDVKGTDVFHRTTSNSFITSSQYTLLETAPVESDRRVIEALRAYADGTETGGSGPGLSSIIDPFASTLKAPALLRSCHEFLWLTVVSRFGLSKDKVPSRPSDLPKKGKVVIQIDNTLRRLRDPQDPAPLKNSETVEVHAAWYLRRLLLSKDHGTWIKCILGIQSLRLPELIHDRVHAIMRSRVEGAAEDVWAHLLEHEHLLWTAKKTFRLYGTQVRLLEEIGRKQPVFVELASPPNTGKTVMAAGMLLACPTSTLVFCCVSPGVYLHVARLLYHLGIYPTFVFGNRKIEPNFKLTRTTWEPIAASHSARDYIAKVIPKARAFIVDLNLCRWFLDQLDRPDTILFLDEPTMGADGTPAFAHVPRLLAKILHGKLPHKVVLSSATLPSSSDLEPLTEPWRHAYPNGTVVRVDEPILTSSISLVALETGHVVLPHARCQSVDDLRALLATMPTDIVLLKAYSGPAVALMRQDFRDVYGSCPSFADAGTSWTSLTLTAIRDYARFLLGRVVEDYRPAFFDHHTREPSFPTLDVNTLALGFSPHVPGQTLIVTDETERLAHTIVDPLIAERKLRHIESALHRETMQAKEVEQQCTRIKDPDERRIYMESVECQQPVRIVPDELVIHSSAHLRRYGGDQTRRFPKEFIRRPPPSSVVRQVLATQCEEWFKHAFLSGVTFTDARLHTQTTSGIVGLTESSLQDGIPVAVVDRTFSYGVNVPCSNVVIVDESAATMSHNSILQFVNRVARMSGTHCGRAFLCREAMERLLAPDDRREADVLRKAMGAH